MSRRQILALAALLLLAFFAPLLPIFQKLELRTVDTRFELRGPRPTTARVVVIGIDDATTTAWADIPNSFWGAKYAAIVRNARLAGAEQIVLDVIPAARSEEFLQMVLSWGLEQARSRSKGALTDTAVDSILAGDPTVPEMTPDTLLHDALLSADGHVVLADDAHAGSLLPRELKDISGMQVHPYVGFADLPLQIDDAARTAPLFAETDPTRPASSVLPGLAVLAAARARHLQPDSRQSLEGLVRGRLTMSGSPGEATLEAFWINPPGGALPWRPHHIAAFQLAEGIDKLSTGDRALLKGAVALVGVTAREGNSDVYRAPGRTKTDTPGVDFQAWAVSTLLDGAALLRPGWPSEGFCAAGLLLAWAVVSRAMLRCTFGLGLLLAMAASILWCATAMVLFRMENFLLPVAVPVLFVMTGTLVLYGISSLEESAARRFVESVFGRNVSPQIRDILIRQDQSLLQQGTSSDSATVLFFDIRGSTAFAETRAPADVIAALNQVYDSIVPIIDANGGLINRFLGDGFLAIFGVPRPTPDHATAAAKTAIEIAEALDRLRESELSGACGVHSGPVVYGYLGAKDRAEFTVIGDTVNVAARLEAMNKSLGTLVVVSSETISRVPAELRSRFQGPTTVELRGRSAPMEVFTAGVAPPVVERSGSAEQATR